MTALLETLGPMDESQNVKKMGLSLQRGEVFFRQFGSQKKPTMHNITSILVRGGPSVLLSDVVRAVILYCFSCNASNRTFKQLLGDCHDFATKALLKLLGEVSVKYWGILHDMDKSKPLITASAYVGGCGTTITSFFVLKMKAVISIKKYNARLAQRFVSKHKE